jgi:hypothetical protein
MEGRERHRPRGWERQAQRPSMQDDGLAGFTGNGEAGAAQRHSVALSQLASPLVVLRALPAIAAEGDTPG